MIFNFGDERGFFRIGMEKEFHESIDKASEVQIVSLRHL